MPNTLPSSSRGLQIAIVFACYFTLGQTLRAQDALRSAIEGDEAYRTRTSERYLPEEGALRAGPVLFQANATYGLEWNDNIYLRPSGQQDDTIHRPQLNLTAILPLTDTSRLNFGVGIGYEIYTDHSDLGGFTITPNSEFAWDIKVKDFIFTLSDRFSYSQEVVSQGTISSGTAEFPRIENTAGLRARWYPSRYVFELGYGHYNFFPVSSGSNDFAYLERSTEQLFARAGWRLAEATTTGLEASISLTDYKSALQSDNIGTSMGPFMDWQATHALNLSLRGGMVFYSFDPSLSQPTTTDFTSYYVGLQARHELTDHIQQNLLIRHDVQQGLNRGSDYLEQLYLYYSVNWNFRRNATLALHLLYENNNEPRSGVDEKSDRYGAGISLTARPLDHLTTSLSYRFATRTSDLPNNDYDQNTVAMYLSYQF